MSSFDTSSMPFYRAYNEIVTHDAPNGIWNYDHEVLSPYQMECITRYNMHDQIENNYWMQSHTELTGLLKFMLSLRNSPCKNDVEKLKQLALKMVRPVEEIDADIRKVLKMSPKESYAKHTGFYFDYNHFDDYAKIRMKYFPDKHPVVPTPPPSTLITESSSFVSANTSTFTLPSPEPEKVPELTMEQIFYNMISLQVDKAIYSQVNDKDLRYDTAYVELMKAVEAAMEIPVIPIRQDLKEMLKGMMYMVNFELDIKAKILAEIAWERRMRKKLKRTLRRQKNFKGYETPPSTPKSLPSSHESYKRPLVRPCVCCPKFYYNRYPKDRFGIYLPPETKYCSDNITILPSSMERLMEEN